MKRFFDYITLPSLPSLVNRSPEYTDTTNASKKEVHPIVKIALGALLAAAELLSLGHILDRIKTTQQAFPGRFSALGATKHIYNHNGLLGFYTGLRWNLLTHCGKAAFRWAVMSHMSEFWTKIIPHQIHTQYPSLQSTLLGLSVGIVEATFLVCPAELIKTKEMTNSLAHFNFVPYVRTVGLKRLFDGVDVVILRQVMSWCSFLFAYEKTNQFALRWNEGNKLNLIPQFGVGAAAGGINVLLTTPFDAIKTQVQKNNPLNAKFFIPAFLEMQRTYGLKSLYSGLGVRMIRSTWYAGLTLTLMEHLGIFRSHHA